MSQYKVYNLTSEDGLLSDNVNCIFQDHNVFLWIGSNDGIVRWDGYAFKKYTHAEDDANTLSNNIVYTLTEDHAHRLWVGTINGLNLYNPVNDTFSKIKIDPSFRNLPINAIKEDTKQRLWLATSDGLCQYNPTDPPNSKWFYANDSIRNGLSDGVLFALDVDLDGNLWIGTFNGGVTKYNPDQHIFSRFQHQPNDLSTLCSNKLKKIFIDQSDRVWVGSIDNGITVLNKNGKVLKHYKHFSSPNHLKETLNNITCIYQDKNKRIWVGLADQPLFYLNTEKDEFVPFLNPVDKQYHITCNNINCMFEDSFGNTWFASERDGLFYSNASKNVFQHYFFNYSDGSGLGHNTATSFCQDNKGNTWIGTNGGGLDYLHTQTHSLTSYTFKSGIKSLAVQDIKSDPSGMLWIATRNGGVTHFDPITGKNQTFKHDPTNLNSIIFNDVTSIVVVDSLIWMGTYGEGVCIYDAHHKNFYHHKNNTAFNFNMRTPGWTNHLFRDSKNRIWIGSYGGLHRYSNHGFQSFTHSANPSSISNHDINMIAEDSKGHIWIATVAGGLELYDEQTNTFIHYSQKYQLPYTLKSIVVDDNDVLWLGSNEGLVSFDPLTKKQTRYGSADGLQGDFFLLKSAYKNSTGELFFGGTNGFNVFCPEQIKRIVLPSFFYFTELSVFGIYQKANDDQSALKKSLLLTDTLTISYDQSFFTVEFTDINFYSPSKTKYAYKLEGLYDQWIDNKSERKISFTNLPPGSYRLKVKYTMPDGTWKESTKTLFLKVAPPWWNSWWFRVLLSVSLILLLVLIYKIRIRAIKHRNEVLEKEVRLRTYELSERNSDLQESNEEIKYQKEKLEEYNEEILRQSDKILKQQEHILDQNQALEKAVQKLSVSDETKNLFFNILAHDLNGPVAAIDGLSEILIRNIQTLSQAEILEFAIHLKQSSEATQKLLRNLLEWARTQSDYIEYHPVPLNASDLVKHNVILLEQSCLQKNIQLRNLVDDRHSLFVDYNMMDTILRNLISNAVKFTPEKGIISISSRALDEEIEISIADTGIGISEENLGQLFDLVKGKSTKGTKGEKGTGLGLVIVKEFVLINKGTIQVESEETKGTTFTLKLPRASKYVPAQVISHIEPQAVEAKEELESGLTDSQLQKVKGQRILIVEDNMAMRNHLKHLLASTFEITEAVNGSEALSLAADIQPIVVITDMVMPVMNGLDLCRALKQNRSTSHIPVIILTSHDNEENKLSGYHAGADIYLTKPARKEMLFHIIFNIVQSQEQLRQKFLTGQSDIIDAVEWNALDHEFIEKINAFIETHLADQELDVYQIVRHMGMSRSVLYAKFKAITGQGINEFIRLVRLKRSKELLKNSNSTIHEIADAVGFNSASYFIRCFAKEYKQTPAEFRSGKTK